MPVVGSRSVMMGVGRRDVVVAVTTVMSYAGVIPVGLRGVCQ